MPTLPPGSYLSVSLFTYRPEKEDEFLGTMAAEIARLDAAGHESVPGWQWSHMVRTAPTTVQTISSYASEEAVSLPAAVEIVLKNMCETCLAAPLVRRTGTIRRFVQGPEYEDDLTGSATFVTTHVLNMKEGGEAGIDAVIDSAVQRTETIFQTSGLVCMFFFKAQQGNSMVLIAEYTGTSAQDAILAAGRFDLLLHEMAPFIADPVSDNVGLVSGNICL